jgi:aspartyl-tRNA(Asn)/glutamyl-tRNA(Gln) amidotransferase subunit A
MRPLELSDPSAAEVVGGLLAARGLPVTRDEVTAVQEVLANMRAKLHALRGVPLSYVEPTIEPAAGQQWLTDAALAPVSTADARGAECWPDEPSASEPAMGLTDLGVGKLIALYRSRDVSPVEVLAACRERIQELDPSVGAIVTETGQRATLAAQESEWRWRDGVARSFDGIPFGVKDIIETAGVRTTGGSRLFADHVPRVTAVSVARLQEQGAVMLAKVHTYEFASSQRSDGNGSNPWDLSRTPGGSSEGSGAAVAARFFPLAIGTDTGGSIRVPSAFCGVVGFKPTHGRVPRHGVMPLSWTMDHVGPMTRSVVDAARALTVMAGHDVRDPTSSRAPVPRYDIALDRGINGLRIGVPPAWFFDGSDPQVAAVARAAIDVLVGLGAEAVDVDIPSAALAEAASWLIQMGERASLHDEHLGSMHDYAPLNAIGLAASQLVPAGDYLRALRIRRKLQDELSAAFAQTDVLVAPGPVCVAPRLADFRAEVGDRTFPWLQVVTRNTRIFSLTGVPTLAVPAGFDARGLPIGIQIAGPPHADDLCLRVGYAYQQVTDWHRRRPPLVAADIAPTN